MRTAIVIWSILFSTMLSCQTILGIVKNLNTNKPIENAAVYFDQTTIGTLTNAEGKFEI